MTTPLHDLDQFFSGTTDEKLLTMAKLFADHGKTLLAEQEVQLSLSLLSRYAAALTGQMNTMDMGELCGRCAGKDGGGCCSSYMEANSDVILLLMNRLQGTVVARQELPAEDCCFLGKTGCTLPIKPMFCLNYNCSHIHARATVPEMASLERLAGKMLTEQTRLEALILQKI
jgi:hypothetical protein